MGVNSIRALLYRAACHDHVFLAVVESEAAVSETRQRAAVSPGNLGHNAQLAVVVDEESNVS
jgi:hypothetical protein